MEKKCDTHSFIGSVQSADSSEFRQDRGVGMVFCKYNGSTKNPELCISDANFKVCK